MAENIETALRQPLDIPGGSVTCAPSAGFAIYPSQGKDFEVLVQAANLAMHAARRRPTDAVLREAPDNRSI